MEEWILFFQDTSKKCIVAVATGMFPALLPKGFFFFFFFFFFFVYFALKKVEGLAGQLEKLLVEMEGPEKQTNMTEMEKRRGPLCSLF